jgi:hypothetical protein
MACRGVHFAIEEEAAVRLLGATDDEAVLEIIQEEIEETWDEAWLYESDKAWDAIHRCLSDGTLDPDAGNYPLRLAVLNGRQLYQETDYIISLLTPSEVSDVAGALLQMDEISFKAGYDAIDEQDYGCPKDTEDWLHTWEYFQGLIPFFQKAAQAGRYVVFSVDQ